MADFRKVLFNLSRWTVVLVSVLLMATLAACAGGDVPALPGEEGAPPAATEAESDAAEAEAPAASEAEIAETNEAPMLAALVEAGELPPLAERLPQEPLVIEPLEAIGEYGGVWRLGTARGDEPFNDEIAYESLMMYNTEGEIGPNILRDMQVNEDATEYTLHLRPGMKWSDGAPLTTEDFMFWYEDVLQNTDLTPSYPVWLTINDELATFEAVDDYTLKLTFAAPNPIFMPYSALQFSRNIIPAKHYLSQFHIDYADEAALQTELDAAGLNLWYELYNLRANPVVNTELPTLNAWVTVQGLGEGIDAMVFERNPYYWKVDTAGNQLPYLDRVELTLVEDVEVLNLMGMDGAFDWQEKDIARLETLPLFHENAERGDYRVFTMIEDNSNFAAYHLNYDHQDPVLRELIRDARFRKALSLAIDRQPIVELVHFGVTEPRQPAPLAGTPFYHPEAETAYLEYDPDQANALLDELGLTERNSEGYRLRPDGEVLRLVIQGPEGRQPRLDASELVAQYWQDVGVQATTNVVSRELHTERRLAREFDVWLWSGSPAASTVDVMLHPGAYVPNYISSDTAWAHNWAEWFMSGGETGEEPPEALKQANELYRQASQTADVETQAELIHQILDIYVENLWVFGIAPRPPEYGIIKNDLRNVAEEMRGNFFSPSIYHPETWFWDN